MSARLTGLLASLTVWVVSVHPTIAQEQNPVPLEANPVRGITAHDPCTIHKHNGTCWTFTTGRGVSSLHSTDLVTWRRGPAVFPEIPEWVTEITPKQRGHFWAPDLIFHNGRYLLYYSISTFGQRTSAIALASASTLDPADPEYGRKEEGIVIQTTNADNFNAIDPSVLRTEEGRLWMAFGSFWSGIKLIELDPRTGLRVAADSPMHALAHKSEIEAATLHFRDGLEDTRRNFFEIHFRIIFWPLFLPVRDFCLLQLP